MLVCLGLVVLVFGVLRGFGVLGCLVWCGLWCCLVVSGFACGVLFVLGFI